MGQTMKEGTVVQWFKEDGETVHAGDDLYEIEYDKATANVASTKDGVLKIEVAAGETVPVSTVVATIFEPGEAGTPSKSKEAPVKKEEPAAAAESKAKAVRASIPVKRMARQMGIDLAQVTPGDNGRITEEDLKRYAADEAPARAEAKVKASPMAKRIAAERGVDLAQVGASDPSGRIKKEDVLRFLESKAAGKPAAPVQAARSAGDKAVPMSGMRKVIARNMAKSYFENPVVTYSTDADMFELLKLRGELNEELAAKGVKVSVNDFLIKAVSKALLAKPNINVSIDGEEIIYKGEINIGFAVAVENGLVVPVVRDADTLKLEEISRRTKELAAKCRDGLITSEEMSGGTFTISNLGMLDIDMFTPIINTPQSAILGVGRAVEKPVVQDGEIAVRPMMVLSLTADHRVIDGAPAAEFLVELKKYIQKPFLLLLD
jgi:pyruvate dehydrogenase E2 component (dihydrolipoamide acetyltransferase)